MSSPQAPLHPELEPEDVASVVKLCDIPESALLNLFDLLDSIRCAGKGPRDVFSQVMIGNLKPVEWHDPRAQALYTFVIN